MLRFSACEVIHNMTELQKQYVNEKQNSKMQAFQRLETIRDDAMKYLPDNFDPDAEFELARKEKYGDTYQTG